LKLDINPPLNSLSGKPAWRKEKKGDGVAVLTSSARIRKGKNSRWEDGERIGASKKRAKLGGETHKRGGAVQKNRHTLLVTQGEAKGPMAMGAA